MSASKPSADRPDRRITRKTSTKNELFVRRQSLLKNLAGLTRNLAKNRGMTSWKAIFGRHECILQTPCHHTDTTREGFTGRSGPIGINAPKPDRSDRSGPKPTRAERPGGDLNTQPRTRSTSDERERERRVSRSAKDLGDQSDLKKIADCRAAKRHHGNCPENRTTTTRTTCEESVCQAMSRPPIMVWRENRPGD